MECVTTPKFSLMINGVMKGFFKSSRGLRQGDPISPLLFVLCMEYLSRILNRLGELEQFHYHPRCKEIKLTHMCFADDLIMCCKGDFPSCYLLLRAFKLFSDTTGLQANVKKSAVYTCGMNEREIRRIVDSSGFTHQNLPFKYLGVPICAKKITAAQCESLVEKMVARIRVWSSRNMSYAARTQLINSVLLSLHQYWAQVFILPKQVLQEISRICRAFLWSGEYFSQKPGLIAWERVCTPKNSGGLGFRDVIIWNQASLGKYVWAISSKQDSIWLKWIHSVYLKDVDWWDYKPSSGVSWYWKKICHVKEQMKQYYTQGELCTMQKYSVKTVYEKMKGEQLKVYWDTAIWNRLNLPKHRFIFWLAIQEKLRTTEKLRHMGLDTNGLCMICATQPESHQHLFFQCHLSKECLQQLKSWLGFNTNINHVPQLVKFIQRSKKSKFRKQVMFAGCAGLIYLIWSSRNNAY
ncbi:uncharacterized protein LOC130590639 [Beta vulgaris subsp. vulgaris]|uniref:uncharacterized protein LOC130590639 n=1 Tax=Beta vulgaris subsp. vulgaris TaxID=3555 RepID=UPI002547354B|nr:uncharacterized protein LOC130590639 [Beta vulgaris subsp. vulgaris]